MRINIMGKDPDEINKLKKQLREMGYDHVDDSPELVVCYGGDGMFLIAERVFPGVPKILLRQSERGNKASDVTLEEALERYTNGAYKIEKLKKLKAISKGRFEFRRIFGINDIVIRNRLPTEAVRIKYRVNGGKWSDVVIGDGVVVSTPFGSGAYFSSIVRKEIESGFGVAFNNPFDVQEPLFLNNGDKLHIEIVRGEAILVGDNNRDFISLDEGHEVTIKYSKGFAKRVVFPKKKQKAPNMP